MLVEVNDDAVWRLQWYPRLLLAALAAAFLFVALTADGSSTATGRLGGDYPAFHGAGSIVLDGNLDSLYDPAAQAAAQEDLLGGEAGFLPFVYHPTSLPLTLHLPHCRTTSATCSTRSSWLGQLCWQCT